MFRSNSACCLMSTRQHYAKEQGGSFTLERGKSLRSDPIFCTLRPEALTEIANWASVEPSSFRRSSKITLAMFHRRTTHVAS